MNKETLDLLQQLAAKLGTTAEHLWSVLVRQAFISGCTDLLFYAFTVAFAWFVFRKLPQWLEIVYETESDAKEFSYTITIVAVGVMTFGFFVACVLMVPDTIAAFGNPEYWALKQVLTAIGGKSN